MANNFGVVEPYKDMQYLQPQTTNAQSGTVQGTANAALNPPASGSKNPFSEMIGHAQQFNSFKPQPLQGGNVPQASPVGLKPVNGPGAQNPLTPSFQPPKMAVGTPQAQNPITPQFTPPPAPTVAPKPLNVNQSEAMLDQFGVRMDMATGAPPKPPGTEDPAIAAQWYSWAIPGITAKHVIDYRTSGFEGHIADWWRAGKPNVHAQNAQPDYTPPEGFDWLGRPIGMGQKPQNAQPSPAPQPQAPVPPPVAPAPPPPALPPAEVSTPLAPGTDAPAVGAPEYAKEQGFDDLVTSLQKMLNPSFQHGQDELARAARANAALTGQIDSGGFGTNLGKAQAGLAAEHSKYLSDSAIQVSEADKERGLKRYAIDTDKFLAKLQDDTARLGIKTNAELERYISDQANQMQKYGIDKNDLLDRYKADVAAKTGKYSADAGVRAASLGAAAQASAAASNAQASMYGDDQRFRLGLANVDTDRERNMMQYILGIYGLGNDAIKNMTGTSPDGWLAGWQPSGDVYVKP
jgi:hypothetical protein